MSTFLQLVNRVRLECGATGSVLTTLQTGLTTEASRFVTWINEGWRDVQHHKPDWQWMRKSGSFQTVASQATYTLTQASATDMADWKRDSFRAYATSAGVNDEQILPFMDYSTWRDLYQLGAMRAATGRPTVVTVTPDKTLAIGPLPDAIYTVGYEYYRAPIDLSADADDPSAAGYGLPARYHMLIVYLAMQSYATFYAAPEVMERASAGIAKEMRRLEYEYLPVLVSGPPLA